MFISGVRLTDITQLRERIWGEVVLPGDSNWDEARQVFNLSLEQNPAAIVLAESAEDVQAAVRYARKHDLRVAPQTTGHNAGPLVPNLERTVIVRTTRMKGVAIDIERRIARVQAGTIWAEVVEKLDGTGLAALHGSSPTVGVVGYSLTGGVGFLARKHGMQVDQVTAIDLVNEFGDQMRVSAEENPELFWAVRGGGGNFGVVTAIEFRLVEVEQLQSGMMAWPATRAGAVIDSWLSMLPDLPDELTTTFRVIQFPPFDEIPEAFRGRQMVVVDGALLGDGATAQRLLQPLRELEPELDTWHESEPAELARLHMDPEEPGAILSDHMLIERPLDAATAAKLVDFVTTGGPSPLGVVELRHIGGALSRGRPGGGAQSILRGQLLFFSVAPLLPGVDPQAIERAGSMLREMLEPFGTTERYQNLVEQPARLAEFYDAQTFARIAAAKATFDKADLFQANFEL